MGISRRSLLTAGVCGVTAGAIVLNPSTVHPRPTLTPAFSYSAYSLGTADAPRKPTPEALRQAVEFVESISTGAAPPTTVPDPASSATIVPSTTSRPDIDVDVQNVASNAIDSVYAFTRYWANYAALDLGPWLINWVPFGYLVSDQIDIWYRAFVLPVVDSFVYQFLDPIVNQPLNPGVWWNGAWAIAGAALNGIVSGFSQEVDYVFSLGWLPFPLPPLAAPETVAGQTGDAALRMSLAAASGTAVTGADGVDALPDGSPAGGTVPSADPPPDKPGLTEASAPEDDPGSVGGPVTSDPVPSITTTIPTPDNSAPTVPAPTPDPTTDPQVDDGTSAGQDGATDPEEPAAGDTQDDGDAAGSDGAGSDDGVQPGDTEDPTGADGPTDTPDTPQTPETPDTPAAPNSASTDTAADSAADSTGSGSSAGGASAVN